MLFRSSTVSSEPRISIVDLKLILFIAIIVESIKAKSQRWRAANGSDESSCGGAHDLYHPVKNDILYSVSSTALCYSHYFKKNITLLIGHISALFSSKNMEEDFDW